MIHQPTTPNTNHKLVHSINKEIPAFYPSLIQVSRFVERKRGSNIPPKKGGIIKRLKWAEGFLLYQVVSYNGKIIGELISRICSQEPSPDRDQWVGCPSGLKRELHTFIIRNLKFTSESKMAPVALLIAMKDQADNWVHTFGVHPIFAEAYPGSSPAMMQHYQTAGWFNVSGDQSPAETACWIKELVPAARYEMGRCQLSSLSITNKISTNQGQLPIPDHLLASLSSVFEGAGEVGGALMSLAFMSIVCENETLEGVSKFSQRLTTEQYSLLGLPHPTDGIINYKTVETSLLETLHLIDVNDLILRQLVSWLKTHRVELPAPLCPDNSYMVELLLKFARMITRWKSSGGVACTPIQL